jgi:hypothetical protein
MVILKVTLHLGDKKGTKVLLIALLILEHSKGSEKEMKNYIEGIISIIPCDPYKTPSSEPGLSSTPESIYMAVG